MADIDAAQAGREEALRRARGFARSASTLAADPDTPDEAVVDALVRGFRAFLRAMDSSWSGFEEQSGLDRLGLNAESQEALRTELASWELTARDPDARLGSRLDRRHLRRLARRLFVSAAHASRSTLRRIVRRVGVWALALILFVGIIGGAAMALRKVLPTIADGPGWRGSYFPLRDFRGSSVERIDPVIDFDWGLGSAIDGGPTDQFSVRWDGCIELEQSGDVKFRLGTDDGGRLFVDERVALNRFDNHPLEWVEREVTLEPGPHHVRVEYFDSGRHAEAHVEITLGGEPLEVYIPSEANGTACGTR